MSLLRATRRHSNTGAARMPSFWQSWGRNSFRHIACSTVTWRDSEQDLLDGQGRCRSNGRTPLKEMPEPSLVGSSLSTAWTSQTGRSEAIQDLRGLRGLWHQRGYSSRNGALPTPPASPFRILTKGGYMWAESIPQIQSAFNLMFLGVMIIVGVTAFYRWLRFLKLDLELCFQPLWRKADDAFSNPRISDSAPSGSGLCVAAGNIVLRQHWTW